ncbi:MAG: hypothetical protein QXD77_02555 [Candidatus Aenigmatarchaeota archaeon]
MPVIGLMLSNITAKRTAEQAGHASIGNNVSIKSVEEIDLLGVGKKGLKLNFEFSSAFMDEKKKPFGEIIITGDVLFMSDNPAELLMGWKKDKKLPEDVNLQCINTVIRRCMGKAITLSEEVNLPPPIPLPFAHKQAPDEKGRYIG